MEIFTTITPIFLVIITGWIARRAGFLPEPFLGPANRLVYHIAIPAMVFTAIANKSFLTEFNGHVIGLTLFSTLLCPVIACAAGRLTGVKRPQFSAFLVSSYHGNLGYVGFAVAFYYLGENGFAIAAIIAGFLIILQNLLSIAILQVQSSGMNPVRNFAGIFVQILKTPVIAACLSGILFSVSGLTMPLVITRSLDIIGNMALPLALLLIGASVSVRKIKDKGNSVFFASFIKLALLPGLGFGLYRFFQLPVQAYLPGLILLASPTAISVYIMAKEIDGDADFIVGVISTTTLLAALTMTVWLAAVQ